MGALTAVARSLGPRLRTKGIAVPPAAIPPAAVSGVSVFLCERSCGSLSIAPLETGNHGATDIPFGDRPTGTLLSTLSDFTSMTETVLSPLLATYAHTSAAPRDAYATTIPTATEAMRSPHIGMDANTAPAV